MKERIDIEPVKEYVRNAITPHPLYLEVRDETVAEGYSVDEDPASTKDELERQVIMELLSQGDFSSHSNDLNTMVFDMKNAITSGNMNELNGFDARLLNVYFVGDEDVDGPKTVAEWKSALTVVKRVLGLPNNHRLARYAADVLVDVANLN